MREIQLNDIIVGRVEPHIYAFVTNTIPNYLKVGDTYRPVSERLKEWEIHFPSLIKQFESSAKINDETYFRDFAIHSFLEYEKGKKRLTKSDISEMIYFSREFFKDTTEIDVKEAIDDIQADYNNRTQKYQFYNAQDNLPETFHYERTQDYDLRDNQKETVEKFKKAIAAGRKNLLMYAVMRFGKSFTSMCCAVEMDANIVVIVSAKADVGGEWKKTVESHKKFSDYIFLDSKDLKRNEHIITDAVKNNKKAVVFLTLQDLQGKIIKDRHKEIFGQKIDLLLVDETHFGARADKYGEVLKQKSYIKDESSEKQDENEGIEITEAEEKIKALKANVTIHLSGTPYRILMSDEFKKDDIIAFYQFTDILDDQKEWNEKHILDDDYREWDNPYYGFPQMIRFAFNPNESSIRRLEELKKSGVTYAFSALFKPRSVKKTDDGQHKKFVYEKEILDLLEVVDGSKDDANLLGFLNYDKIKEGNMCRHMVIVLPYCASCDALENLLKAHSEKFLNLNQYEIVNISGVEDNKRYKDTEAVKNAITNYEKEGKKTITLTVNRMLTGSTVPQWDTMLYLKDTAAPQEYDQAIFRLQSQYIKNYADDEGNIIKYNMKPQTLLVDFDPYRMFTMQAGKSQIYNFAVDKNGNSELKSRMEKELEYSPIITLNSDKITEVDASDILKAISNYNRDKGIAEEAATIAVDMGILEYDEIKEAIAKENELGSKAGLTAPAHKSKDKNEEDKGDLDTPQPSDGNNNGAETPDNQNKEEKSDEKDPKKQIQSFYVRILLYAYLTKDKVISLSDILSFIDKTDNTRILSNLGLDKNVLKILNKRMNRAVLSQLDYKIQDLNELSHAMDMEADKMSETAFKKFGKLAESIVFTPANICKDMVDLFPDDLYDDITKNNGKVLDIAATSGEFAVALYNKMNSKGIKQEIISNAIYSIPKSPICYELIRKIYGMLGLNIKNIATFNAIDLLEIKDNRNKIDYKKISNILRQKKQFNEIIITDSATEGDRKMKFSAIVGNPPYQVMDGGAQASARPIYHEFVNIGKKINATYLTVIMPSRWFAGGKGLDEFRVVMLNDKNIQMLHDFLHPEEVFPATNNRGGICYFLRNKNYDNSLKLVQVVTHEDKDKSYKVDRKLKFEEFDDIFIRDERAIPIIQKIRLLSTCYMDSFVSPRKPFGIESNVVKKAYFCKSGINLENPIKCYGKGKQIGFIDLSLITMHKEWIPIWKVYTQRANNIGTELNDDNLNTFVGEPNSICTEAYTFIGVNLNLTEESANNLTKYFKTKMARYMHRLAKASQDATAKTFRFVPLQDFTLTSDIDWSKSISEIDKQLYKKYNLTDEEIAFIESMIKPME